MRCHHNNQYLQVALWFDQYFLIYFLLQSLEKSAIRRCSSFPILSGRAQKLSAIKWLSWGHPSVREQRPNVNPGMPIPNPLLFPKWGDVRKVQRRCYWNSEKETPWNTECSQNHITSQFLPQASACSISVIQVYQTVGGKFSEQSSSLELPLCHTEETIVVSPWFSPDLEHQVYFYNCKDVKVARFLQWTTEIRWFFRFLVGDMSGKERLEGLRVSKPGSCNIRTLTTWVIFYIQQISLRPHLTQATVLSAGITNVNSLMVQGTCLKHVCLSLNYIFYIQDISLS